MEISVCIGSSCHLRGSYSVIKEIEHLIEKNNLKDKVNLNAAFCLGNCTNGVTTRINGTIVTGVTMENVERIFNENILNKNI